MLDKIYSMLSFTGIPIGGAQTLPHGLVLNGVALTPDFLWLQFQTSFELVSADAVHVTIRNTSNATGNCLACCQVIHPAERSLGIPPDDGSLKIHMTPQPFCPGSPNAGGGGQAFEAIVFRPGGVESANVVTTWADALALLSATQGLRILQFDDSIVSPIVIPAGGPYDMTGVTWSSIPDRIVEIQIPQGTTFTKLRAFDGRIDVNFTGTTPPIADFASPSSQIDTVTVTNGAELRSTGAGPLFSVTDAAQFNIGTAGAILTGTHALVNIAAAVVVSVFVEGPVSIVAASTFSGIVGATLNLVRANDSATVLSESQAGFLGTLNLTNDTATFAYPTAVLTTGSALSSASQTVRVNPTGGTFSVTLPAAAGLRGQSITIKNISDSTTPLTIAAGGGDNIDGAATQIVSGARFHWKATSDGVNQWMVVG